MRSLLIYLRCGVFFVFVVLVFFPAAFIFDKSVFDKWLRRACRVILRLAGVRVKNVTGLEHIRPGEPYIVTSNHVNFLEPFIYQGYYPYLLRGLEKKGKLQDTDLGKMDARYRTD